MVAIYRERDDIRAVSDFIVIYCGRGNFLGTTKSSAQQQRRRLPARVAAALERSGKFYVAVRDLLAVFP